MRSIVIAFLIWQCSSHWIVSCTQTKSTKPLTGTTHSAIDSTIAHADRKGSAIVADRNSVTKISRSEIVVGQRPVVDTSLERSPKQANPASDSKGPAVDVVGLSENFSASRRRYRSSSGHEGLDVSGRSIDSSCERSCDASRDCDSTLNERCVASNMDLVRRCDQEHMRNKVSCDLAGEADPIAVQYENAWQRHAQNVARDAIDSDAVGLSAERERWLLAELRKIRQEFPQKSVLEKKTHSAEELSSDAQDLPIRRTHSPPQCVPNRRYTRYTRYTGTLAGRIDPPSEEHEVPVVERQDVLIPEDSAVDTPEVTVPQFSRLEEPSTHLIDSSDVSKSDERGASSTDPAEIMISADSKGLSKVDSRAMILEGAAVPDDGSVRASSFVSSGALAVNSPRVLSSVKPAATAEAVKISTPAPKESEAEGGELAQASTSEGMEALRSGTSSPLLAAETTSPSEQSARPSNAESSDAALVESMTVSDPAPSEDAESTLMKAPASEEESAKSWESEGCDVSDDRFCKCMISERPVGSAHESTSTSILADPEVLTAGSPPTDTQEQPEEYSDSSQMDQKEKESGNSSARSECPVDGLQASEASGSSPMLPTAEL